VSVCGTKTTTTMPSFFEVQLLVLTVFCGLALFFERFILKRKDDEANHKEALDDAASSTGSLVKAADRLGLSYLGVYAVVMGMWFPQVVSCVCCPQTVASLHTDTDPFSLFWSYPIC